MLSKIIGAVLSIALLFLRDFLFQKKIELNLQDYLRGLEINTGNRKKIIKYIKTRYDFLSYIMSAITALATLALTYDFGSTPNQSVVNVHVEFTETEYILRSLIPIFLIVVIVKSFLSLNNGQPPYTLQKASIILTSILIIFEVFGIL